MKSIHKRGSLLLAAALLPGLFPGLIPAAWAATDITDKFTDLNFRAAVYETIGKTAPEPIWDSDVAEVAELDVDKKDIQNLMGLEYFTGLTVLSCVFNQLTELPELPSGLTVLNCSINQLTELPTLPSSLTWLSCDSNELAELPELPSSLRYLHCYGNLLTTLPALPPSLEWLGCGANRLTLLPELPSGLTNLGCNRNQLTLLPVLPSGLTDLNCHENQLTSLPALPSGLKELWGSDNQLSELDVSGLTSLELLDCRNNDMTSPADVKGFTGVWDGFDYRFYPQQNSFPPPLSGLSAWAEEEVNSLHVRYDDRYRRYIIPLSLQDNFQEPIQRDEFIALLAGVIYHTHKIMASRQLPFTDIEDSPYKTAIIIAYDIGLIDGTSATTFSPDGLLTREQTAKMLYTLAEKIEGAELGSGTPDFTDKDKISGWAVPYVAYAQAHDLMQGSGGQFDPQGHLTREQAMLVAERLIARYGW